MITQNISGFETVMIACGNEVWEKNNQDNANNLGKDEVLYEGTQYSGSR